jgi:hypothetical protein
VAQPSSSARTNKRPPTIAIPRKCRSGMLDAAVVVVGVSEPVSSSVAAS